MQDDKNKIEAILFTIGKFITIEELTKLCNIKSISYVKQVLEELKKEYDAKNSALQIIQENNRYKLNIKKEYGYLANRLVSDSELDNPTTKTLAIIAYKQPVLQSNVIKIRGNKAYAHVKSLVNTQLISSEKSGRTRLLKLSPKFYDYFDIAENTLKDKLNIQKEN